MTDGAPGAGARWRETWGLRVLADARFVHLAVAVVLLLALGYRAVQFVGFLSSPQWGYDFSAYWLAGRQLLHGEPIYTAAQLTGPYPPQGQFLYLYPPLVAALGMPFALVSPTSYGPGAALWTVGGAVVTVAVVVGLARLEGLASTTGRLMLLLAATFAFPPLVGELTLGNVHLLLLGLLALAWWGVRRGGRRGEALAGAAIGAAAMVKLFPALLLLWLAATGRWRSVGWALGAAVALVVLTLPVTGLEPWLQYPTVLLNLGPPVDATDALAPAVWLGLLLPSAAARLVILGVGLVVVAWSALRLDERASYGIAVAVSVLVAPALFQHYLALMLLPLLFSLGTVREGPPAARLTLGASYLAMWAGQQPALGVVAWILNRGLPTLGALGVPATLARWAARRNGEAGQEA